MKTALLLKTANYCKHLLQQGRCNLLQFHNFEHTAQVAHSANVIALESNLTDIEREMVVIAAYFHDVGNKEATFGHEKLSCDIAREFLQKENFPEDKIRTVENIILSTEMGRTPTTLLEEIVNDADLSHLGMESFINRNRLLREEWANFLDRQFTDEEWTALNIQFLNEHHYYTDVARKLYAPKKLKNLLKLKEVV